MSGQILILIDFGMGGFGFGEGLCTAVVLDPNAHLRVNQVRLDVQRLLRVDGHGGVLRAVVGRPRGDAQLVHFVQRRHDSLLQVTGRYHREVGADVVDDFAGCVKSAFKGVVDSWIDRWWDVS